MYIPQKSSELGSKTPNNPHKSNDVLKGEQHPHMKNPVRVVMFLVWFSFTKSLFEASRLDELLQDKHIEGCLVKIHF